jgi:hypothetical protein
MHTRTKVFSAAAIVAALAAGGAAFTDSNTMPINQNVGYGTVSVTGATVDHIDYNVNATDASKLDGVTVWIAGDHTASTVTVQWNNVHTGTPLYATATCTTVTPYVAPDTEFDCSAPINAVDATDLDVTLTTTPNP